MAANFVEIYNDSEENILGVGCYGKVCMAKYGQLPCVAKLLMFEDGYPERFKKFEEEYLNVIKHPNIVQYLGTFWDPQSQRLALLMELMDENDPLVPSLTTPSSTSAMM